MLTLDTEERNRYLGSTFDNSSGYCKDFLIAAVYAPRLTALEKYPKIDLRYLDSAQPIARLLELNPVSDASIEKFALTEDLQHMRPLQVAGKNRQPFFNFVF